MNPNPDSRLQWRTSSRSSNGEKCIEVALVSDRVFVRDTKNRAAGAFSASAARWQSFVDSVKADQFR